MLLEEVELRVGGAEARRFVAETGQIDAWHGSIAHAVARRLEREPHVADNGAASTRLKAREVVLVEVAELQGGESKQPDSRERAEPVRAHVRFPPGGDAGGASDDCGDVRE